MRLPSTPKLVMLLQTAALLAARSPSASPQSLRSSSSLSRSVCYAFEPRYAPRAVHIAGTADGFATSSSRDGFPFAMRNRNTSQHRLDVRRTLRSSPRVCLLAKPKSGNAIESFQTVSVNCAKCGLRLFRYKKKNGTKSNLVKCFIDRISEDCAGVLETQRGSGIASEAYEWCCPQCETKFARSALIRGAPALKMVGGKIRMTKK